MTRAAFIAGIVTFAVLALPADAIALAFLSIRSPTATGSAPGAEPAAYATLLGLVTLAALGPAALVAALVQRWTRHP